MVKRGLKRNEKRNQNNQGFSLVELIVVIAIMAVLVAVLAPQFTRYIDRSRQSVDAQTVSGIVTSVQIGVADVTTYTVADGTYTIVVSSNGTKVYSETDTTATEISEETDTTNKGNIVNAIKDSCGELASLKETSKAFNSGITIQVEVTNGVATVKYSSDFADYIGSSDKITP